MHGTEHTSILRFLTCGSVDDGKSTLIGHLLCLTGNIYDDQLATLEAESRRIGKADGHLDYSLLMDGLMAEREQGITIDVAYRYFETKKRKYIVADTPGHEQYTRNMATGASQCSAAIILVDVCRGVLPQTRRHALICALMGIRQVAFAFNKMDCVAWSEQRYRELTAECQCIVDDLAHLNVTLPMISIVPVSALFGDNLIERSEKMPWYTGGTVLNWLESIPETAAVQAGLRLPVQYVIRSGGTGYDATRSYAGRLCSGTLAVSETILVLPSGAHSKVTSIVDSNGSVDTVGYGRSVTFTTADPIDIHRGDLICHPEDRPGMTDQFKAYIVWMQPEPLFPGRSYTFRNSMGDAQATVTHINGVLDLTSYKRLAAAHVPMNGIADIHVSLSRRIPFDPYSHSPKTGNFVLIDRKTNATAAGGIILHELRRSDNIHWQPLTVTKSLRGARLGQKPALLWLTGLSGAGKSTIANALEMRLHAMGRATMLLDGDNVRHGLNRDLGFTEADRVENIRRVGEVSRLMVEAGLIVMACFISPYRRDRDMVRALFEPGEFLEVFVDASLMVCEERDPKGLYKKARAGLIPNFTGVNAPYEAPLSPEVHLITNSSHVDASVEEIIRHLKKSAILVDS